MAIRFQPVVTEPKQRVRTANDVAPLDGRIANDLSRKIPPNYRDNYRDMPNYCDKPKRGRPPTGKAMTAAERQRRCRERRDRAAASNIEVSHLNEG